MTAENTAERFEQAARKSADDLLASAARQVQMALSLLNRQSSVCGQCGQLEFDNRVEAKLGLQLEQVPDRLRKAARALKDERAAQAAMETGKEKLLRRLEADRREAVVETTTDGAANGRQENSDE